MLHKIVNNRLHLLVIILTVCVCIKSEDFKYESSFTAQHIRYLKNETRQMFNHAWSSYMNYGFPADEVRPETCEPYGPDFNDINNIIRNDAMGNVSLTVLDNLDTLIIMEEWDELENALAYLKRERESLFDKDTIVQVFESTIRSLGGLLSTHLLLTDVTSNAKSLPPRYTRFKEISDDYDGFLLTMAYELGLRLLPAFKTATEIPVPRINLAKGVLKVPPNLQKETCTSGATSPVLEFTLLSKLTGDPQFEYYTQRSFWKLWSSRLILDLMPMTIDPIANKWMDSITGIGASVDSFYEYAAKSSILFNDENMWSVFTTSYKALLRHLAQGGGYNEGAMVFGNIGVDDGLLSSIWIDLLGAFWAGLEVLTGQLKDAIKTHLVYLKIWDHFDLIPERWGFLINKNKLSKRDKYESIILEWYPLRPEFIESTYYLYRATRDPMYLQIGARILKLLQTKFKAKCGFRGIQDIRTGQYQNRMETFVMSETLKYLILLFDVDNEIFIHTDIMHSKNWIFSTEAHPMWFDKRLGPPNHSFIKTNATVNQDPVALKNLFFEKMKMKITSHDRKLTAKNESLYKNVTVPKVQEYDIPNMEQYFYINKSNPFSEKFSQCELNTFNNGPSSFLFSGYYKWNSMFNPDYLFRDSLIKPSYLLQSSLDGSYIELTKKFYDNFAMIAPEKGTPFLQCPRPSSSSHYELFIGDIVDMNKIEVSQLRYNEKYVSGAVNESILLHDDLWVPELNALRLKFEKLSPGVVDLQNNIITEQFIQSVRVDDYNAETGISPVNQTNTPTKDNQLVLRVNKVNGIFVKPGLIIWTLPFNPEVPDSGGESLINIASDGRIILQGNVVENIMVWYG